MNTTSSEQLQRRATLLTQCAGNTTTAKAMLELASINARAARADLGVMHELDTALAAITRLCKRAELQRLRLLRKADRQGATP